MKKLITTLLCSSLLLSAPVFSGSGHEHGHGQGHGHSHGPISKEKAIKKAQRRLKRLVAKGKVDKSWQGKKAASAEKKEYKGKQEWLVTFNNSELSDKSKQTLYMFFRIDGHYLATNYTGK